jgi:hypothetical protein
VREFTRLQWKRTLQNIIPPYSITFYFFYTYLPLLSSCLYFLLFFYWTNFISIIVILNLKKKKKKKRKWNMHMYCVLCSVFICLFSHKRLRFVMELRYCTCQGPWRLWFLHEWRYYIVKLHIQQKQNLVTCKCISKRVTVLVHRGLLHCIKTLPKTLPILLVDEWRKWKFGQSRWMIKMDICPEGKKRDKNTCARKDSCCCSLLLSGIFAQQLA